MNENYILKMITQNSKNLRISNGIVTLCYNIFLVPATVKCLFLTLQDLLKGKDRKFEIEVKL